MRGLRLTAMILIVFILIHIGVSEARRTFPPGAKPNLKTDSPGTCRDAFSFAITEAQRNALESFRRAYMAEAIPIRTELFALKIELRHLVSDPNVQPKILFDEQRKISALRAKLEELSLSYQVKARSIFTKEQLERLPLGWEGEIVLGHEIPKRSGKGFREQTEKNP